MTILALVLGVAFSSVDAKPGIVQYTTYLTDLDGNARSLTNATVRFRLYRTQTGGQPLWTEEHTISTSNGRFNAGLGTYTQIPIDSIHAASDLWLEMQVNSDIYPRQHIAMTFSSISAMRADTAKYADKARDATTFGGLSTTAFSDTGHTHARVALADSSQKAALADSAIRIPMVDSGKIALGAVSASKLADGAVVTAKIADSSVTSAKLASGAITAGNLPASKNGNFEVVGILSADSLRFRSAKRRKINLAGNLTLPMARRMSGRNLTINWHATSYTQIVDPSTPNDTIAIFIPFNPPANSTLRKITARVSDTTSALPNVAISLYAKAVTTGGEINYYYAGTYKSSSTSASFPSLLIIDTTIPMNPDYAYMVMGIYEGVDNSKTAFQDVQLEFDIVGP